MNSEYMKVKLLTYFAVNFNWLFTAMALIVIGYVIVRKKWNAFRLMFPILVSALAYLMFSSAFVTVAHPRYIDAFVPELYVLMACFLVYVLQNRKICFWAAGLIALPMLVSSYHTVDPIMKTVHRTVNVGKTELVYMDGGDTLLTDSWIYNRQYQDYGGLVDLALEDIVEDPDAKIYIPLIGEADWNFNAMSDYQRLEDKKFVEDSKLWNTKRKTRMTDKADENNIVFTLICVPGEYDIKTEKDCHNYYLYTDYAGTEYAEKIRKTHEVNEEKTIWYRSWKMNRLRFE